MGVRTNRWTWFGWDALPVDTDGDRTNGYDRLEFNAANRYRRVHELYDRQTDPAQIANIYGTAPPDLVNTLEQMTQDRFDCRGAECIWEAQGT